MDWENFIAVDQLRPLVLSYCDGTKSVAQDPCIPWPVVWLVGGHHVKHRFAVTTPIPSCMDSFLKNFESRLERQAASKPAMRCWLSHFHKSIMEKVTAVHKTESHSKHRNVIPLVKVALSILTTLDLILVRNDKASQTPGFTLVHTSTLKAIHERILASSQCKAVPAGVYSKEAALKLISNATKAIKVDYKSNDAPKRIRGSAWDGKTTVVSVLDVTCKAHKPAGEVSFRDIHMGQNHLAKSLGIWLHNELQLVLRRIGYLLTSTGQFVRRVGGKRAPQGSLLVRADIKHFFMSGKPELLLATFRSSCCDGNTNTSRRWWKWLNVSCICNLFAAASQMEFFMWRRVQVWGAHTPEALWMQSCASSSPTHSHVLQNIRSSVTGGSRTTP